MTGAARALRHSRSFFSNALGRRAEPARGGEIAGQLPAGRIPVAKGHDLPPRSPRWAHPDPPPKESRMSSNDRV
jgi:hypothetical protein